MLTFVSSPLSPGSTAPAPALGVVTHTNVVPYPCDIESSREGTSDIESSWSARGEEARERLTLMVMRETLSL